MDTPAQAQNLKTWTERRDKILGEISAAETKNGTLLATNTELSKTNSDLVIEISKKEGILEQINKQENDRKNLISADIVDLEKRKSILEVQISELSEDLKDVILQKKDVTSDIDVLKNIYKEVFDRTSVLQEIVGKVKDVSHENITEFKTFFASLKKSVQEIIDLNTENVKGTKFVLEKLPETILQFRRPVQVIRPVLNKRRGLKELKEIDEASQLKNGEIEEKKE